MCKPDGTPTIGEKMFTSRRGLTWLFFNVLHWPAIYYLVFRLNWGAETNVIINVVFNLTMCGLLTWEKVVTSVNVELKK